MKTQDSTFHCGHRARLRKKFLDGHMADYELLELLLSFVIPRRDVRPLARGLIKKYGGIYQILSAPIESLIEHKGIGTNTAIFIKAMQSAMLTGYRENLADKPVFSQRAVLQDYCRLQLVGKKVEEIHILYLNAKFHLIADDCHNVGSNRESSAYPREILLRAMNLDARNIIMLHNHPTPDMKFSTADWTMTKNIKEVLARMDIYLYDHVLVSGDSFYSMLENAMLND